MANPLDPIWRSYETTLDSFAVVRSSLGQGVSKTATFLGTQFASAGDQQVLDLLDAATGDLENQTVMFLYATFEAALRDHVIAQAGLFAAAVSPSAQFGVNLQEWFIELCGGTRMDQVVHLFIPSVNQNHIAQAGTIESTAIGLLMASGGGASGGRPAVRVHVVDELS